MPNKRGPEVTDVKKLKLINGKNNTKSWKAFLSRASDDSIGSYPTGSDFKCIDLLTNNVKNGVINVFNINGTDIYFPERSYTEDCMLCYKAKLNYGHCDILLGVEYNYRTLSWFYSKFDPLWRSSSKSKLEKSSWQRL